MSRCPHLRNRARFASLRFVFSSRAVVACRGYCSEFLIVKRGREGRDGRGFANRVVVGGWCLKQHRRGLRARGG